MKKFFCLFSSAMILLSQSVLPRRNQGDTAELLGLPGDNLDHAVLTLFKIKNY
jgi:hypothetical protein